MSKLLIQIKLIDSSCKNIRKHTYVQEIQTVKLEKIFLIYFNNILCIADNVIKFGIKI